MNLRRWSPARGPYQAIVEDRSQRGFPFLKHLAEFMDAEGMRARGKCTLQRFYAHDRPPSRKDTPSREDLKNPSPDGERVTGRLIILEDLSTYWIEKIGLLFEIDPMFFAGHVRISEWNPQDDRTDAQRLPSSRKEAQFIRLRYSEIVLLDRCFEPTVRAKIASFNVFRRMRFRYPTRDYKNDNPLGLVNRMVSYWWQMKDNVEWDAVLLVDPPLVYPKPGPRSHIHHLTLDFNPEGRRIQPPEPPKRTEPVRCSVWGGGYVDFSPWPGISNKNPEKRCPEDRNMLEDVAFYLAQEWEYTAKGNACKKTNILVQKIVLSYWMVTLAFLRRDFNGLGLYRLSLNSVESAQVEEGLNDLTSSTNLLARSCWSARQNLYQLHIAPSDDLYYEGSTDHCSQKNEKPCEGDWVFVYRELEFWEEGTQKLIDSHRDNLTILDTKRDQDEAHDIDRLSKLGMIYLPLSFVAAMLGMSDNFVPGKPKFWIFWVTAIPLMALTFLIYFYAKAISLKFERKKIRTHYTYRNSSTRNVVLDPNYLEQPPGTEKEVRLRQPSLVRE